MLPWLGQRKTPVPEPAAVPDLQLQTSMPQPAQEPPSVCGPVPVAPPPHPSDGSWRIDAINAHQAALADVLAMHISQVARLQQKRGATATDQVLQPGEVSCMTCCGRDVCRVLRCQLALMRPGHALPAVQSCPQAESGLKRRAFFEGSRRWSINTLKYQLSTG